MTIERVTDENFCERSLDNFNRSQYVNRIYKKFDAEYEIIESEFIMDWSLEKKRHVARDMLSDDHISYIAVDKGRILGFVSAYRELYDGYMAVDMVQVDLKERRHGLGRKMFEIMLSEAEKANAKGLYISACPAEETINFYLAMGCRVTDKPIEKFAAEEPNDVQMVYLF